MKVAICISGHLRTFDKCINNIRENIFKPVKENFDTDIFLSTWEDDMDISFMKEDNIIVDMEKPLIFDMGSKNYLKYPNLCCHTTCDNATSMWYKVGQSFGMVNDAYDLIIRIRPDVIYENKIDIDLLKESISNNKIYMSKTLGKYMKVTKGILEPFSFGNRTSMANFMNTYHNIKDYIKNDNIPHTIEGFLYESIKNNKLERIDFKYSILRENGLVDKLYN